MINNPLEVLATPGIKDEIEGGGGGGGNYLGRNVLLV